jgi:hypothetical protein
MSLVNQGKAARKKSVWGHNTGTSTEDVYTCPANCVAELTFLLINNSGSSTNTVDVKWYDASGNNGAGYASGFITSKSLNAGDSVQYADIELVLEPGDKIQLTPTSSGHIDSILTFTETFVPVG